jgi:hypothetical protein
MKCAFRIISIETMIEAATYDREKLTARRPWSGAKACARTERAKLEQNE